MKRALRSVPQPSNDEVAKFHTMYTVNRLTGCWNWRGSAHENYGFFKVGDSAYPSHRVSYTIANGEIPFGLLVDHMCWNKSCCNPDHLEAVSDSENVRRGWVASRWVDGGIGRVEILQCLADEEDEALIEAAATADALPVMDWIRATAIREARKRVAQLRANTGKA